MFVEVRDQRQIANAEIADWAREARLALLVSGHTGARVNYAASDRGANIGAYSASSGAHDLGVVAGGISTYSSVAPGAASVNYSAFDALGNGDFTLWFVAGPIAASASVYKQILGQSGASGACWLTANSDENYGNVSGQMVLGLLQTGIDRSSIKAAGAIDGAAHAWCVRKKGTTGQWWRDGVPITTTTSGTLAGSPTAAADTVYLVGSSLDGSAAFPEGLVMLGVCRTSLGDDRCARLSTRRGAWRAWAPRRIWVPGSAGGGAAEIGLATETDTALALTAAQQLGVGQAQETDSALPLASAQARTLGQAIEQDSALTLTSAQTAVIGLAIEQDIAQPIGSGAVAAIGQAVESDTAQPLTAAQRLAIGLASETDTAQPLDVVAGGFLGIAQEADTAQPLIAAQRLSIGQAQEADTALALLAGQGKAIGLALEGDTAQPLQALLGIGLAQEQDTALPLIAPPPPPPPPATESETTVGYRRNPRTPLELDPLPADDVADQVRDKWDAIERANEAVRRARRGPPPAAAVAPTQAPTPKPQKPRDRRATAAQLAAVAAGLGMDDVMLLTPEQRADEEAFILLVAELV